MPGYFQVNQKRICVFDIFQIESYYHETIPNDNKGGNKMSNDTNSVMTIRYTNGDEQKVEFQRAEQGQASFAGSRIQETLTNNYPVFDLGDRALVIPTFSIQSIEVTPPPANFPQNVIRNARLLT